MPRSASRGTLLACIAVVAVAVAPTVAHAADAFPFEVHHKQLANGLDVYAIPYDSPGVVAYYSVVRTGSRNEVEKGRSGFAHFFEHMMFRGTDRYSAEAYNDVLKRMGADSNAWTWNDQTVYYIVAGVGGLPKIVELEADRFQNLTYGKAAFQKEARAVLGEYNKSASNPRQLMNETLRDLAFDKHTYEHTTIGFLADIEAMPGGFRYARKFFDRWYRPDNVSVVCAGDVEPDAFFALVEQHYAGWKRGKARRPKIPQEPPQTSERRKELTWATPTQPRLLVGWHSPAFTTETVDHAALEVLANAVFAQRSPLYRQLVIEEQKAVALRASNPTTIDPLLFEVSASLRDAADLPAVEAAVYAELARVSREGIDDKTLAEVKSHLRYGFAAGLDTPDDVASTAAWFISVAGRVDAVNDWYDRLAQVTIEDVKRVAGQVFVTGNRTVVTLLPPATAAEETK